MKKFITAFSIIIICYFASYYNVNAMSTTISQSDIPNIFDIGMALGNGIELDISQFEDIDEFMDTYKEKRFDSSFLNALDVFYDLISDDAFTDNSFYSICFPNEFQMNMDTYNQLSLSYQDYLLHGMPLLVSYNDETIARWSNYDRFYVDHYLNDFQYEYSNVPQVPVEYVSTVENINVDSGNPLQPDFFFSDASPDQYSAFNGNISDYSYVVWPGSSGESNGIAFLNGSTLTTSGCLASTPITCNITTTVDGFHCTFLNYNNVNVFINNWSNVNSYSGYFTNNIISAANLRNATTPSYVSGRDFTTIEGCINYINTYFRNVIIVVNGDTWSDPFLGNPIDIATAPDVIRNDDGDIIGQDCFLPDIPGEGFFDLTKFWDMLIDAIEDPTKDVITWDDVIENGVIVDDNGTALDDTQIKTKDISEVISNATTSDPAVPEDDSDVYKNVLPPLPPLIRFPDIKPGGPHPEDAFDGISVLARIINVTNKSMPEDIMYVFWGIIFGMITLGLIKVLHK